MNVNWWYGLTGVGVFTLSAVRTYQRMTGEVNRKNAPVIEPIDTTIVLPTLNEEYWIANCIESLLQQNIIQEYPDYFQIIVADSRSKDQTVTIAQQYPVDVLQVPKGKLTARHVATEHADGEIIVAVDADCVYPVNWLNLLLQPLQNEEVVAVGGSTIVTEDVPLTVKLGYILVAWRNNLLKDTLLGRNSAYRKQAYYQVGGFNLDINQQDVAEMTYWEEHHFPQQLKKIGKVEYVLEASTISSPRMYYCPVRLKDLPTKVLKNGESYMEWCQQIETGTRF